MATWEETYNKIVDITDNHVDPIKRWEHLTPEQQADVGELLYEYAEAFHNIANGGW